MLSATKDNVRMNELSYSTQMKTAKTKQDSGTGTRENFHTTSQVRPFMFDTPAGYLDQLKTHRSVTEFHPHSQVVSVTRPL